MNAITIIYIVIATIFGAITMYFLLKINAKTKGNSITNTEQEKLNHKYEKQLNEANIKVDKLKVKYEQLLRDANNEITTLNKQLKDFIDGNIDDVVKEKLTKLDQLKKEISNLEDDIDDYEDDIKQLKKKIESKELENLDLQDSLFKEQRNCKQLQIDLDAVKEDLNNKNKDLTLKIESLAFVQEILTAKQVSDASTKDLHKQIDAIVRYISGELKDNIKASSALKDEDAIFGSGLQRWAIAAKKTWIQGKTTIAFVGEFSAGKTSIVNRILSQDDPNIPLLPVSTKATTAIPTYISGGPSSLYQFVSPDNIQKIISEDTFKKINKDILEQIKGVSSLIQYFVMKYNNPNLEKISILDTPGFNSNDKEDAERTIAVINECDALFWVFDVNVGTVNRSSISLIKENLRKPLYVIINKVDTKAETEINSVEQLIRKTLQDEGITVQKFIRFSAKAPLDDIMQPVLSVTHNIEEESYIIGFREMLNGFVEELNKNVQELNKKQLALHKQGDKLIDKYNNAIRRLENNCEEAANIPQWTTHLFRKDRFEMDESQGNRLINLLNTICNDRANELCKLYSEQMENQRNAQQAYSDYIDEKIKWQKLNSCAEKFEKLIKTLQVK